MNPSPIYRASGYNINPNMAKIPAAMTLPVSFAAAPVGVALGWADVAGVPFVGEGFWAMASPPTPVELTQSVVMKRGSATNVISAHCLVDVRYWREPKEKIDTRVGNTNIVESTTSVTSLYDLNCRVRPVCNTCNPFRDTQCIPAESSQSSLLELIRKDDVEILSRWVVSESQIHSSVGFIMARLELEGTAGQWPQSSRGRWSVESTTRSSCLGLIVVTT